jgi:hypothetical protein
MHTWSAFVQTRAMGNSGTELCKTFRQIALRTNWWLTASRPMGLAPAETTITDLNVFELEARCPKNVRVKRFGTRHERAFGADWRWVIGSDRAGWLEMWIQAKRLSENGRRYDHLGHPPEKPSEQVTALLKKAGHHPALYCFYNGDPPLKMASPWPSGSPCSPQPVSFGCAVASAQSIEPLIQRKDHSLASIGPLCAAWADLVCCGSDPGAQMSSLQGLLRRLGANGGQVVRSKPAWAAQLIDGQADLPDDDFGADGVVVVDLDGELGDYQRPSDLDVEDTTPG